MEILPGKSADSPYGVQPGTAAAATRELPRPPRSPSESRSRRPSRSKRRGTANRKERRRTQSINSAFAELRECIPNVPADTKLSKIKTLRLATSYIAYLMDLLAKDDQNGEAEAFKAEIKKTDVKEEKRKKELNEILKSTVSSNDKKTKGRTGWPQHVWALELKQ
ncbi:PREDICTED: heart- and neural crest derivatives-expressed protein 2 [Myotis brandtii]|uniref:heart- and neural crest derivatives-expressed protein 2 n=1 Tax=Myotis brandtii TaxID=109478 RepID=UPI0003BBC8C2|nr:PREDICTED: heart- and neural crest derivatives-expressed protein 2 [Myotis brandtii]